MIWVASLQWRFCVITAAALLFSLAASRVLSREGFLLFPITVTDLHVLQSVQLDPTISTSWLSTACVLIFLNRTNTSALKIIISDAFQLCSLSPDAAFPPQRHRLGDATSLPLLSYFPLLDLSLPFQPLQCLPYTHVQKVLTSVVSTSYFVLIGSFILKTCALLKQISCNANVLLAPSGALVFILV